MNESSQRLLPRVILVAVDAEGLGAHAIHAGLELARALDAKVELVHAVGSALAHWELVDDVHRAAAKQGFVDTASKAMVRYVHQVLEDLDLDSARAEEIVHVEAGFPGKAILERAEAIGADLIVLGPHRKRGMIDFGSTVRHVLARTRNSVWTQPGPVQPIRRIVAPVDLSKDSLGALAHARELAKVTGAHVRAIHCFQSAYYVAAMWPDYPDFGSAYAIDEVRKSSEAEFAREMRTFDWKGVPHDAQFVDGDPTEKIVELAHDADLIVMGTHGRTGFSSVVLGSVAYAVLKRSDKPVWAIRIVGREFEA